MYCYVMSKMSRLDRGDASLGKVFPVQVEGYEFESPECM